MFDPNGVEIEVIAVAFSEPEDGFVPTTKTIPAVGAMFKVPDDSVPKFRVGIGFAEQFVYEEVEREYFAVAYMVAYLPAYRAARFRFCENLLDDWAICLTKAVNRGVNIVGLPDAIRRRCECEVKTFVRDAI